MTTYCQIFGSNDSAGWGLIFRATCNGSFGWFTSSYSPWIKSGPAVVDDFGDLVPV